MSYPYVAGLGAPWATALQWALLLATFVTGAIYYVLFRKAFIALSERDRQASVAVADRRHFAPTALFLVFFVFVDSLSARLVMAGALVPVAAWGGHRYRARLREAGLPEAYIVRLE